MLTKRKKYRVFKSQFKGIKKKQQLCLDSYKNNPSQSPLMTHQKSVAVSVCAKTLPSACMFLLFCCLGHFWVSNKLRNDNGLLSLISRSSNTSVLGMRLNNQPSFPRIAHWCVYKQQPTNPAQYNLYLMLFSTETFKSSNILAMLACC